MLGRDVGFVPEMIENPLKKKCASFVRVIFRYMFVSSVLQRELWRVMRIRGRGTLFFEQLYLF